MSLFWSVLSANELGALTSGSSSTTTYVSIPQGRRVYRKVKQFLNPDGAETAAAPEGHVHRWREMLHFGQRGTGFAECHCGGIGVIYGRDQRREPKS